MERITFRYFSLEMSNRKIYEVSMDKFSSLILSDLYVGGQVETISEIKDNDMFFFQTIGRFTGEDLSNIKKFIESYE
jgi:hypothetical protein